MRGRCSPAVEQPNESPALFQMKSHVAFSLSELSNRSPATISWCGIMDLSKRTSSRRHSRPVTSLLPPPNLCIPSTTLQVMMQSRKRASAASFVLSAATPKGGCRMPEVVWSKTQPCAGAIDLAVSDCHCQPLFSHRRDLNLRRGKRHFSHPFELVSLATDKME